MDKLEFLRAVLADEGFYCVVGLDKEKKKGGQGRPVVQKFFTRLEDVVQVAEELSENGYNAYYALSTFENSDSREGDNALYTKALFLDVDYGEIHGKPSEYATFDEAFSALKKFCKAVNLPRPTLVSSGGGIHAYWTLAEKVAPEEWFPVASRLKELCVEHGFAADPVVTSDCARILRVPGTLNYRDVDPRDVKFLQYSPSEQPLSVFKELLGESTRSPLANVKRSADELTDSLSGDYPNSSFKRIMQRTKAGDGCEQLKYAFEKQKQIEEPVWLAALSIGKHTIENNNPDITKTPCYKLSYLHPDFKPHEMEDKLRRLDKPMLCATFNDRNPGICKNCPHWEKIKSPISLGKIVLEQEPPTFEELQQQAEEKVEVDTESSPSVKSPNKPIIPWPYFRGENGGIYKRVQGKGEEEGEVPILRNDLYVVRRQDDSDQGTCAVLQRYLPKDGMKEFTIPLSIVGSKDEFRKKLNHHGIAVLRRIEDISDYVMRTVETLQDMCPTNVAYSQFGWTDDTMTSFILGDKIVYKDRIEPNAPTPATKNFFEAFKPKGSIEGIKSVMNFYNGKDMEPHQFAIGIGFGSIFTSISAVHGALYHMYSPESGVGKTTSTKASLGIWGDPSMLMMKDSDTNNAKLNRASVMKNLPLATDEMTNTKPEDCSYYVLNITDGTQKSRMKTSVNEERTRGGAWSLLGISTGNAPLTEKLILVKSFSAAEAMRVLQAAVNPLEGLDKEATDRLSKQIQDNYGHMAIPYLQHIMSKKEEVIKMYENTRVAIDKKLGFTQQYRYYSVLVTGVFVGLHYAAELGYVDFDLKGLFKWLKNLMNHVQVAQSIAYKFDAERLLTDFVRENFNCMHKLKSTDDGRNTGDLNHLAQSDATPRFDYKMRYEYDTAKLYIFPKPLKTWCALNGIGYEAMVDKLRNSRAEAEFVKKRMGKGLRLNLPTHEVLMVNWSDEHEEAESIS